MWIRLKEGGKTLFFFHFLACRARRISHLQTLARRVMGVQTHPPNIDPHTPPSKGPGVLWCVSDLMSSSSTNFKFRIVSLWFWETHCVFLSLIFGTFLWAIPKIPPPKGHLRLCIWNETEDSPFPVSPFAGAGGAACHLACVFTNHKIHHNNFPFISFPFNFF